MKLRITFLVSITLFALNLVIGQTTSIPDSNFEQALIDLGYDTGQPDGLVANANIENITFLDVSNKSIVDLTGIESFIALDKLYCFNNNIENLTFTNNTSIDTLWCNDNPLVSLVFVGNSSINELIIRWTSLTSVDLSGLTELTYLHCEHNNDLSFLNIANGNCENLSLSANFNAQFLCIQVDADIIDNIPSEWSTNLGATYSIDCFVSVDEIGGVSEFSICPNPVSNLLKIQTRMNAPALNFKIFNICGELLMSSNEDEIDVSDLTKGIYFLEAELNSVTYVKKFIKY